MWFRRKPASPTAPSCAEPLAFDVAVLTDRGCVREHNEDHGRSVRPGDDATRRARGTLVLVADGMGGHAAGEVASATAAEVIARAYYTAPGEPAEALRTAFEAANAAVHAAAEADRAGMGTTCVALVLRGSEAFAAHVGDSRLYRLRAGVLDRLTEDHSLVGEMVGRGLLTEEEARAHEQRNVITRALGVRAEVEVTLAGPIPVEPGDVFVLCSDGLHEPVEDAVLTDVLLATASPLAAAEGLIEQAKALGAPDNVTVGVVAARAAEPVPAVRATRELPGLPDDAAPGEVAA